MSDRATHGWGFVTVALTGGLGIPSLVQVLRSDGGETPWWAVPGLVLSGLFLLAGLWLLVLAPLVARHRRKKVVEQSPSSPPGGLPVKFDALPVAELEIVLEREEVHPFNAKANLVETRIEVRNLTDKVKHLGPVGCNADDRPGKSINDNDVHQEKAALERKRNRLPGNIEPGGTVSGWLVWALPYQPQGGVGPYTLTVKDELGAEYTLRQERRGPAPLEPPDEAEVGTSEAEPDPPVQESKTGGVDKAHPDQPRVARPTRRSAYKATHIVQGDGSTCLLRLRFDASPYMPVVVKCEVTDPNGSSAVVERQAQPSLIGPTEVAIRWPNDFRSVASPGEYVVDWYVKDLVMTTISAMSNIVDPWTPVAIDSFVS